MKKNPWELEGSPWKSEAQFWTYIRGGLRKALWMRHPVKINYLQKNRFKAPLGKKTQGSPEGQLVWCCICEICGKTFKQTDMEVDHIIPSGSLKTIEDLENFIVRLAFVTYDDLRVVDKECHKITTYGEKSGLTFEQAKKALKVVAFKKEKAEKQREILSQLGEFTEEETNSVKKRVDLYSNIVKEER